MFLLWEDEVLYKFVELLAVFQMEIVFASLPDMFSGMFNVLRHVMDVLLRHHDVLHAVYDEAGGCDVLETLAADVSAPGVDISVGPHPGGLILVDQADTSATLWIISMSDLYT